MACKTGSATNIIYGLALGYKSAIIPVFVLAAIIFTSFQLCGTYGEQSKALEAAHQRPSHARAPAHLLCDVFFFFF